MNPKLPSASSVVDYLNTKNQDSSFGARRKLYNDLGFSKVNGDFVGSSSQNLNLLKRLQAQDTTTNATPEIAPGTGASSFMTNQQATPATPAYAPTSTQAVKNPFDFSAAQAHTTPALATNVLQQAGFSGVPATTTPAATPAEAPITPPVTTPEAASAIGASSFMTNQGAFKTPTTTQVPTQAQAPASPQAAQAQATDTSTARATGGISASSLYPDIFKSNDSTGTESDVVNTWLNSAEGQAFLNRQNIKSLTAEAKNQAVKAELESKYASDKTTLEDSLAAHGLAFSGIRSSKVRALATSLAASELGADRELATTLLESDADLRDAIIKGVADLAKDAADGRKEAIQQLNSIGYAVIGDELVPNLASQSAARAEESAVRSERRLQLAEQKAEAGNTANTITWAEATQRGLPLSIVGQSEADIVKSFYSPTPPEWFKTKVDNEKGTVVDPAALQKLWTSESQKYVAGVTESADHQKATAYFKGLGDVIAAEDVQKYADQVEQKINGGQTYREAIQDVIDENELYNL